MAAFTCAWRGGSHRGRPGWRLQFPYNEESIDALKAAIPAPDREWHESHTAAERYWWVAEEHQEQLPVLFPWFEAHLRQASLF